VTKTYSHTTTWHESATTTQSVQLRHCSTGGMERTQLAASVQNHLMYAYSYTSTNTLTL